MTEGESLIVLQKNKYRAITEDALFSAAVTIRQVATRRLLFFFFWGGGVGALHSAHVSRAQLLLFQCRYRMTKVLHNDRRRRSRKGEREREREREKERERVGL